MFLTAKLASSTLEAAKSAGFPFVAKALSRVGDLATLSFEGEPASKGS